MTIHNESYKTAVIVAQNLVRSLSAHTESSFKVIALQLGNVAQELDSLGPQPLMSETVTNMMAGHVESLEALLSIVVIDARGNLVQSAISDNKGGYLKVNPINVADREYFRVFADAGDSAPPVFIGKPIQGRINGAWFIPIAHPRKAADGTFAGVVLGTIRLETFGNLYATFDLPSNASVALVKNNGVFLARFPFRQMFFERSFADNAFFKDVLPLAAQGVYDEKSSIDDHQRVITYQSLEDLPLVVVVTQTRQSMIQERMDEGIVHIMTGILATLALIYFSRMMWLQSDTIIRQRNSLKQTVEERTRELSDANEKLKQQALVDGLTGACNRRHLEERLELEFRRAQRNKIPISLVMIDADHFKIFNDTHGHLMGDDCLKRIVDVLKANAKRPTDMVARYGGEEFCCLLPDTGANAAAELAETFRREVEDASIGNMLTGKAAKVTVSIGVATMIPGQADTSLQLIDLADKALYQAKHDGRNLVRHAA